eukprot:CAMPEP_0175094024 /NCGR_PEP_ID=MMETSP0086_2-20121207/3351_1 /TAXON_ID=136419 /ORGANISM="Unknown Unknown, Strain D1" /LENGTH=392 /DNA_ID=CAMNT_0016367077 /DNA_START=202 /DNA_END=1380 /DNA_ORIENTATION=+
MKLRMEPANKAEIQFLKLKGALGKRAPSCSLLNCEDMTKLLKCFGKMQIAERLRRAMQNPPILESSSGFLDIPADCADNLPCDTVPVPSRRRKVSKAGKEAWEFETMTPPPPKGLLLSNLDFTPSRGAKRSASPPRFNDTKGRKQRKLSYPPPAHHMHPMYTSGSCSCPDCQIQTTGAPPAFYQMTPGAPFAFPYPVYANADGTFTYYPAGIPGAVPYIPPQNLLQGSAFAMGTAPYFAPQPHYTSFLSQGVLNQDSQDTDNLGTVPAPLSPQQLSPQQESPEVRPATPPPINTKIAQNITNDSTLLGQQSNLSIITPILTPADKDAPTPTITLTNTPPPPLFKIDPVKTESSSPIAEMGLNDTGCQSAAVNGTPVANLEEMNEQLEWYFGQ